MRIGGFCVLLAGMGLFARGYHGTADRAAAERESAG